MMSLDAPISSSDSSLSSSCPRVGVISIHPAPYRDPTFTEVCKRGQLDLQVMTLFEYHHSHKFWDLDQPGYPNIYVGKGCRLYRNHYFQPRIIRFLQRGHFDVVIVPGISLTTRLVMLFCRLTHTPYVYSSDGVFRAELSPVARAVRRLRDRALVSHAGAIHVPGKAARAYFQYLGVCPDRVFEGCYQLDSDKILASIDDAETQRNNLRAMLGIDEHSFIFLMVANMTYVRCHRILLGAFRQVRAFSDCHLLLIGEGPQRSAIEKLCNNGDYQNVRVIGGVPYDDLTRWFVACDGYVHSGYEPYSTAVAYAATASRPIVVSRTVGAAQDYIIDGETGYLCDPQDIDAFARNMLWLAQNPQAAKRMGERGQKLAVKRNTKWAAEQLERAVITAIRTKSRRIGKRVIQPYNQKYFRKEDSRSNISK